MRNVQRPLSGAEYAADRCSRAVTLIAAFVGYAGALGALVPSLDAAPAFVGLVLVVLAPAPLGVGRIRMRRILGFDPPPPFMFSIATALGVGLVAAGAPAIVVLPAALCALQGHLLAALSRDGAAAWSPPIAVMQVLSGVALAPSLVAAALVPLVLVVAVAAQLLLLARITRRHVVARALGAPVTGEIDAGAVRRIAYSFPLTAALVWLALMASPLATTPPWELVHAASFGSDGDHPRTVNNTSNKARGDAAESGMSFSSEMATNGIPIPAYEILMEVVPRDASGELGDIGPLHLRGIVLSQFTESGVRMRGTHIPTRYRDADDGTVDGFVRLAEPRPGEAIQVSISQYPLPIEPQGWNLLFSLERTFAIGMDEVRFDADRLLVGVESPADWFTYVVEAARPGSRLRRVGRAPAVHDDERFVQLPPASPQLTQIIDGGRSITAGSRTDLERVRRLVTHFSTQFEYSLEDTEFAGPTGLVEFLDRRSGFCAQYASACVLMLRGQGLPARVVTGFLASEWNAAIGAYQVRPRDTHAWFEVHFAGVGWIGFDSTPPDLRRAALGAAADAEAPDALAWAASLLDRIGTLATSGAGVTARDVFETLRAAPESVRRGSGLALIALVFALLGLRAARALRRAGFRRTKVQREIEGLQAKLLTLLARHGFHKRPATTSREFACSVIDAGGVVYRPLARITEDLYGARFGHTSLDGAARARIQAFLVELKGRGTPT